MCVRQQDGELLRVLFRSRILYALRGPGYYVGIWVLRYGDVCMCLCVCGIVCVCATNLVRGYARVNLSQTSVAVGPYQF